MHEKTPKQVTIYLSTKTQDDLEAISSPGESRSGAVAKAVAHYREFLEGGAKPQTIQGAGGTT